MSTQPGDATPERFKTTPFSTDQIDGAIKLFDDPDMVTMYRYKDTQALSMAWSTGRTAQESLEALEEFIDGVQPTRARLLYRSPEGADRPLKIRDYRSMRLATDAIARSDASLRAFVLQNRDTIVRWAPQWEKVFPTTSTQEISIDLPVGSELMNRWYVSRAMGGTALPGLQGSIDSTLSEFAVYLPELEASH